MWEHIWYNELQAEPSDLPALLTQPPTTAGTSGLGVFSDVQGSIPREIPCCSVKNAEFILKSIMSSSGDLTLFII